MNKIALALILLILPFSLVYTSPRKKVGIVLSGGGAKGVAHIGVIKALEELNILLIILQEQASELLLADYIL